MIRCSESGCGKPLVGPERPLRPGEKEEWGGPCRSCRGKRGRAAARLIYEIHHRGFGGPHGRAKA